MNCDDFEKRIHQLLDLRVFVTHDKSLMRHAEVCRHCRSTLEAYADLDVGLAVWEAPQLDDDFARRVVAAVEPARPATRVPFTRLTIAAVAAGLLVALFPAVRNAFIAPVPQPPSTVVAMPTPGPEAAAPEQLHLGSDLAALTLLPAEFLGVSSNFVRQPISDMWQEWTTTLALSLIHI